MGEKKNDETGQVLKEIMASYFLNMARNIHLHIQEARVNSKQDKLKEINTTIYNESLKTKDTKKKKKVLKTAGKMEHITT